MSVSTKNAYTKEDNMTLFVWMAVPPIGGAVVAVMVHYVSKWRKA